MNNEKIKPKLNGTAETMLQCFYARAMHSKNPKNKFHDAKAEELIDRLDYDFSNAKKDTAMSGGIVARSVVFDELVSEFISKYPDCTVVNIACGLDTRAYRMDNGRLTWYNLDLPETIEVRDSIYQEKGRISTIACSVLDEKWAIVSDFIKGKTLAQLMKENPEKKTEYINTLVDLQLEIQSKKCSLLNNLYDKMKIKISQSVLDKAARDELYKRLEAMPHHDKVCHGDFNPSNIIIADDGKAYIIDWAHASQGNASADAAGTYLSFCLDGDIDGAGKYLDIFCQKSGTAKHYVQKWMPIVAASQSAEGNEKEREFFLSRVNVTEDK